MWWRCYNLSIILATVPIWMGGHTSGRLWLAEGDVLILSCSMCVDKCVTGGWCSSTYEKAFCVFTNKSINDLYFCFFFFRSSSPTWYFSVNTVIFFGSFFKHYNWMFEQNEPIFLLTFLIVYRGAVLQILISPLQGTALDSNVTWCDAHFCWQNIKTFYFQWHGFT